MTDSLQVVRKRGIFKFVFWTAVAAAVISVVARSYMSGEMAERFYHRAAADGYAVNVDSFKDATKQAPVPLRVATAGEIEGLMAVRVKKGDRLPRNTTGVISDKILSEGKRASLQDSTLRVLVPWEIQQSKGFKFKDTFKHKGIETSPWGAMWNVGVVFLLGLSLGLMAEGFTDMLGIRLHKIQHHVQH